MIDYFYQTYEIWQAWWEVNLVPHLPIIKIISFAISIVLFFEILLLLTKSKVFTSGIRKFFKGTTMPALPKGKIVKQWQGIVAKSESANQNERKIAVIEADKLMDDILQKSGYKGETVADRLKKLATFQYASLDDVWFSHKIRNRIAHETEYELDKITTERSIEGFQKFFEELELI